jgi:Ca2+-binding RTX toxin-like protein
MKKLILSIAATSVVAISGHAQQLLFTDAGNNSTDTTIAGVANHQDLNLELLVGSTSGTVTTDVVTLLLSATSAPTTALGSVQSAAGDITTSGGDIYDATGSSYSVPAGTAWAQVLAWTGNYSTYAAALASGQQGVYAGESALFQIVPPPAAGSPPSDISNIEAVGDGNVDLTQVPTTVVPEPTTLAMAGVGLASMLIFRRKNK